MVYGVYAAVTVEDDLAGYTRLRFRFEVREIYALADSIFSEINCLGK